MKIPFVKMESIGNDFPVVDLDAIAGCQLPELAIKMADRKFGVGGDGLLALGKWEQGLRLRMFNPDGTEDFCGNGLRCAATLGFERGWVGKQFLIDHDGRLVKAEITDEVVITAIGRATDEPSLIPANFRVEPGKSFHRDAIVTWNNIPYGGSALSTGSTHVVLRPGLPTSEEEFLEVSQAIENSSEFPERTSVIWRDEVDQDRVKIRIWERGAGETLGCGTGSAAVAAVIMREQGRGATIQVDNPGGSVWITAPSWDGELSLLGTARTVYEGVFTAPCRE